MQQGWRRACARGGLALTSTKQIPRKDTSFEAGEHANGTAPPYAPPTRQTVALSALRAHARNYVHHPAAQLDRIKLSLQTFGQGRSVVVWHDTIIAGHGVVAAARALGWPAIQVDVLDPDMPEAVALAYLVADNELARLADPDQAALAALLQEMGGEDDALLAAMGYDDGELRALLAGIEVPDFQPVDESEQPRLDQKSPITCPHCGMEFVPK